jgi:hypothetical protein
MQIASQNSLVVDTDLTMFYVAHYHKFETMECLVDEGNATSFIGPRNATSFIGPLIKAVESRCLSVVHWFVNRVVNDIEMCLALTTAASNGHFLVASYLLAHIPLNILEALSQQILKVARGQGSKLLDGVAFFWNPIFQEMLLQHMKQQT